MDDTFHSNAYSTLPGSQLHQLNSLPHLSSQRYSDHHGETQILPPINGLPGNLPYNFASIHGNGGNTSQTPIAPHASSTPTTMSSGHNFGFPQMPSQPPLRTLQPPLPAFSQPGSAYSVSQAAVPSVTTAYSNSQSFTSAPMTTSMHNIRPRPQGGLGFPMSYGQPLLSQPHALPNTEPEPTHVVGQQGRRGVLPSAPGRAAPGSAKTLIPQKDADGKFPCPHCTKTYLHAKHLKRHLLRHTGDRPYMCKLCKDTFSRSDILKRHFQKCSIRRGVTGDMDHLEGSRAHLNRNRLSTGSVGSQTQANPTGISTTYGDQSVGGQTTGIAGVSPEQSGYASGLVSTRSSRANSLIRPGSNNNENRNSMSSIDHLTSSRTSLDSPQDFGTSTTPASGLAHGAPGFNVPSALAHNYSYQPSGPGAGLSHNSQMNSVDQTHALFGRSSLPNVNGIANHGQGHDLNWGSTFQSNDQDGFFATSMGTESQTIKAEADLTSDNLPSSTGMQHDNMFSGLYSNTSTFGGDHMFDNWDLSDPLQGKAEALVTFCVSNAVQHSPASSRDEAELKRLLTVDNVKHFLEAYKNFQWHWPMIHMPTFNPQESSNGLVLAMICVGAVYSDRVNMLQVRWLMGLAKQAVQRSSRVYAPNNGVSQKSLDGPNEPSDLEDLQALCLLHTLFTWHGNHTQRHSAGEEFWRIEAIARQVGLLHPIGPEQPGFSPLHQPNRKPEDHEVASWSWTSWTEQEKRSRLMFFIFLLDAAMVIFFNRPPQLDMFEIRLCLPCDDAAWDAKTANECADALGIHGHSAQEKNITGSRRLRQIEMRSALNALVHPTHDFQPGTTNVYAKFILIHALHVQIWNAQRQTSSPGAALHGFAGFPMSGSSTPLSQNDWIAADGSTSSLSNSNNNSGHVTPIDGLISQYPQASPQLLRSIQIALDKWKRAWDTDINLQYPPSHPPQRRVGFCRDAIHFYWVAQSFLRNRAVDWQASADTRFAHVMTLLKRIKSHIVTEQGGRGLDVGSIGDIDDSYGIEDITLDMKLLFTPIPAHAELSNSVLRTNLMNSMQGS